MMEQWGLQLLNGIGRMFLNPLLYWIILLLIISGTKRIYKERTNFGVKIFDYFNETKQTFLFALVAGVMISIAALLFGFVFTSEMLIVIAIVTILLSITGSFHLLSPAYTLGITFIIFMLLPLFPIESLPVVQSVGELANIQFVTLAVLIGVLLFVETLLIYRAKENHIYPSLTLSDRGVWLGKQQLKRMSVIPFFLFIPAGEVTNIGPILPYFQIGDVSYFITLIPLIIGTQITGRSEQMMSRKNGIAKEKLVLSIVVLLIAIASYFYFMLSFIAIVVAIVGTEWITYRNRTYNRYAAPLFAPLNDGIKVLARLPGSRAEDLGILPGEIISKVNGMNVTNSEQFYKALQHSGAFFKLDVLDSNGEVRFIQSAFYATDHHNLGLIFPEAPYDERHLERLEQLN